MKNLKTFFKSILPLWACIAFTLIFISGPLYIGQRFGGLYAMAYLLIALSIYIGVLGIVMDRE